MIFYPACSRSQSNCQSSNSWKCRSHGSDGLQYADANHKRSGTVAISLGAWIARRTLSGETRCSRISNAVTRSAFSPRGVATCSRSPSVFVTSYHASCIRLPSSFGVPRSRTRLGGGDATCKNLSELLNRLSSVLFNRFAITIRLGGYPMEFLTIPSFLPKQCKNYTVPKEQKCRLSEERVQVSRIMNRNQLVQDTHGRN